eukprot:6236192-Amphidinium_carterae.1
MGYGQACLGKKQWPKAGAEEQISNNLAGRCKEAVEREVKAVLAPPGNMLEKGARELGKKGFVRQIITSQLEQPMRK